MDLFTKPWDESGCLVGGEAQVATLACIWPLLNNIINAAIALSGIVALVFIIWSGIQLITASGDAEKISGAKKTLTFAIIGLVFILLSFALFNGFLDILGVDQDVVLPGDDGVDINPNR